MRQALCAGQVLMRCYSAYQVLSKTDFADIQRPNIIQIAMHQTAPNRGIFDLLPYLPIRKPLVLNPGRQACRLWSSQAVRLTLLAALGIRAYYLPWSSATGRDEFLHLGGSLILLLSQASPSNMPSPLVAQLGSTFHM